MGMRLEKMAAEWKIVKHKAFLENWQAFKQEPGRPFHHLLDVFTESFRHGPYWSSHVWVPLWIIYTAVWAFGGYRFAQGSWWIAEFHLWCIVLAGFGFLGWKTWQRVRR